MRSLKISTTRMPLLGGKVKRKYWQTSTPNPELFILSLEKISTTSNFWLISNISRTWLNREKNNFSKKLHFKKLNKFFRTKKPKKKNKKIMMLLIEKKLILKVLTIKLPRREIGPEPYESYTKYFPLLQVRMPSKSSKIWRIIWPVIFWKDRFLRSRIRVSLILKMFP